MIILVFIFLLPPRSIESSSQQAKITQIVQQSLDHFESRSFTDLLSLLHFPILLFIALCLRLSLSSALYLSPLSMSRFLSVICLMAISLGFSIPPGFCLSSSLSVPCLALYAPHAKALGMEDKHDHYVWTPTYQTLEKLCTSLPFRLQHSCANHFLKDDFKKRIGPLSVYDVMQELLESR